MKRIKDLIIDYLAYSYLGNIDLELEKYKNNTIFCEWFLLSKITNYLYENKISWLDAKQELNTFWLEFKSEYIYLDKFLNLDNSILILAEDDVNDIFGFIENYYIFKDTTQREIN